VPRTYSLGKPHPIHLKKIKSIFPDTNNRELLFVGDTLSTDIQLAEESDRTSCLVLSGNTKRETLKNFIIEPDYIIDSIKNLKDIII
jgi:ribonucleotide monophosphatase NagD (HAD superfamily)